MNQHHSFLKKIVILFLYFFIDAALFGCTMVMVSKDGVNLVGNNEDWKNPKIYMWIVPASPKTHGRVCFGFDRGFGFAQGGMNDRGLFIDGNALSYTGWKADSKRPIFNGAVIDHVLSHCATVSDVSAFFRKYNHPSLARARFPVADAEGNAAIFEWGRSGLNIVKRRGRYQISTNFVQSNYRQPSQYPCHRYRIAEKILSGSNQISVDLVRNVLSATHSEYAYPTQYSFICNLDKRVIHLYYFHHFEAVYVLDLESALKKGRKSYFIPDLFDVTPQAARQFERSRNKNLLKNLFNLKKE